MGQMVVSSDQETLHDNGTTTPIQGTFLQPTKLPASSSLPRTTPGTDFCHHRFTWLVLELGINVIVENVLTSFTQDTVGASAVPFHCCVLFHGTFTP